jgi:hypothetical protein
MSYYSPPFTCSDNATATDFGRANLRGRLSKIIAILTGRSNQLLDLETISRGKSVRSCHYTGTHTVKIADIKGSENSCQDFDQNFNPIKIHNRQRWISIARAWQHGISLPAIDLVKIRDTYIVRDGHHRISVAKYMGADFIDARVTEWVLAD